MTTTQTIHLDTDPYDVNAEDDSEAGTQTCVPAGNALAVAEAAFDLLTTGPSPLAIDGSAIGHGLPARAVDLAELRRILLDGQASQELKDAVWAELVRRSREGGSAWVIGCVGVAMPGLKAVCGRVRRSSPDSLADDIVSELVTEFVAQLARIDITAPRISAHLILWACKGALRVRAREMRHDPVEPSSMDAVVHAPKVHPADLLTDAVQQQIITPQAAEMITVTRLERRSLASYARSRGIPENRLRKQRKAAETLLVKAIREGQITAISCDRLSGFDG